MVINFDEVGSKTLSPAKLAHVVLRTQQDNFARMVSFYKTFLGAHATHEDEKLSFITYDDEHHRIAIAALPGIGPRDPKACGLEHISFTFNSLEDLLFAYRQRRAHDILPVWCVNHGVTVSIYYRDPDGNHIETQVDVFETPELANAFMDSPENEENPIGVDFDPEDLIQKLQSGVSAKELLKRPNIGPRGFDTVPLLKP